MPANLPTVLVVDDDRVNRMVMAELLRDECRLILAKDGPSALQRMRDEDVSLVLLDVSMPGMDGYEVLAQIKADKRTSDVGVIFITGHTDEADEERGLLLGAADYVSKPIHPAIVRARIKVHLKLAMQRRQLERLSMQDGLTGIANRRRFDEALDLACRHAARAGEPIGLALFDVDHFKQYNDCYGHGAGDEALRQVAGVLASYVGRPYDVAARYGGEEFVLLLPAPANFELLLERLREEIISLKIPHARSEAATVLTISGGALVARLVEPAVPAALLERADILLYSAKSAGRNRIMTETVSLSLAHSI
ncbi:diguanylate cyclase domain-containing protein [Sphingobium sp. CR28]|uniref:diguanylate cyclase domain-containing protein n=1 Tax=Sphingobium sp. CR28 TaxID=3400272 RepID=UPI003FF0BCDE